MRNLVCSHAFHFGQAANLSESRELEATCTMDAGSFYRSGSSLTSGLAAEGLSQPTLPLPPQPLMSAQPMGTVSDFVINQKLDHLMATIQGQSQMMVEAKQESTELQSELSSLAAEINHLKQRLDEPTNSVGSLKKKSK